MLARARASTRADPLIAYLCLLGLVLLVQGTLSIVLRASGHLLSGPVGAFAHADYVHATIHVIWGAVMLALVAAGIPSADAVTLALVFGVFYTGLAVLGVSVHHPFGLILNTGENVFHFIVGPLTLLMGLRGRAALRHAPGRPQPGAP